MTLPSRVLDVSSSNEQDLKLYVSRNEPGRYVCLSHRWGTANENLVTTRDNLLEHQRGIPWHSMPQVYRDAVTLTRTINVPYLWIDSLCIVQDDDKDWDEQSSKMASIYTNAVLTLAATSSKGPAEGCFSRIPFDNIARTVIMEDMEGNERQVAVRRRWFHLQRNEPSQGFPLLRRAWVYQERLLSTRMLYCIQQEVVWECMEEIICECKGQDMPSDKRLTWWHRLIEDYSALDMTFEKDKLPALSGVASRRHLETGYDYLAGLWKQTLVTDLLWSVKWKSTAHSDGQQGAATTVSVVQAGFTAHSPETYKKSLATEERVVHNEETVKVVTSWVLGDRPAVWRAPTWSWASVSAKVSYDFGELDRVCATVIEAKTDLAGSNPMGEVVSGYIVASGLVVPMKMHYTPDGLYPVRLGTYAIAPTILDYDVRKEGPGHVADGETVCCLRVAVSRVNLISRDFCLILRPADQTGQVYTRIGLVSFYHKTDNVFGDRHHDDMKTWLNIPHRKRKIRII